MIRRGFRLGVLLAVLVAATMAATRVLRTRRDLAMPLPPTPRWEPEPAPTTPPPPRPVLAPGSRSLDRDRGARTDVAALIESPVGPSAEPPAPKKKAAPRKKAAAKTLEPWVAPVDGACPPTHLVKAKLASKLYHEPGMFAYDRTRPDRCYLDGPTAEADSFTRAKR